MLQSVVADAVATVVVVVVITKAGSGRSSPGDGQEPDTFCTLHKALCRIPKQLYGTLWDPQGKL